MRFIALGLLALLGGCANAVEPYTAPDGRQAYVARCGGGLQSITDCYAYARKQCGGNYDITNRNVTPRQTDVGATENREIEFVCKS